MADAQGDEAGQLSPTQQDALQQYLAVTNQEPKDAIPLLERSQWNVQIAIAKFFDGEGPDLLAEAIEEHNAPRVMARHENLQESLLASEFTSRVQPARERTDPAPRIVPQQQTTARTPFLFGLLLTPFSWGWTAVSTLFRTILYTMTFLPAAVRPRLATSLSSTTGRRMLMPRDAAARFKREFDEEYGPNELDFFEGGIAQAHDLAKKELKFLMVVLLSQEHDDTQSFVRDTLLAPDTVTFLKENENNVIIWGGSVVDSEAYQVATEYSCTKFPFTALVCLTPKEGSTRMGIVKRLTGPMPATTYLSELQAAMEKYGADMASVRAERTAREVTRSLRDQQDSAYERSLAKDKERAREKREAAAAVVEAERRTVQAAKDAARLEELRYQWRQWRASQIQPEPAAGSGSVVRVAVKMPESLGAERIVRRFAADAPMEELYAFVECYDLLREGGADELTQDSKKPDGYEHKYMFKISSTLPRHVHESSEVATMGDKIGKSSNLIVEEILADESDDEDA